mgnify:CR=1 FL=1
MTQRSRVIWGDLLAQNLFFEAQRTKILYQPHFVPFFSETVERMAYGLGKRDN